MNQEKLDIDRFVTYLLSTPLQRAFRVVVGTWWVFRDDFWVIDHGGLIIDNMIRNQLEDLGYRDTKKYLVDRIRQQLKAQLTTDRLPGRVNWADDPLEQAMGPSPAPPSAPPAP